MAVYTGNDDYVSIDGTSVSSYWVDIEITPNLATTDTTHGSGVSHMTRNAGLKDHSISMTIIYDAADHATLMPLLEPGEHTVIWGPQGNTAGQPKHEQKFIFTEAPTSGNYEKSEKRVFSISGEASAAPVSDLWGGDTW